MLKNEQQKGIIALVFLSLIFASMGIFGRYLSVFPLLEQVYLRIAVAFVLALIFFRKDISFSKIKKISGKEWGVLVLRSVTLYVLGVTLVTEGYILAKYGNASFISSIPFTALFGVLLLKEKLSMAKFLLILGAFFGATLIGVQNFSDLLIWGRGETLTLISAMAFSLSYVARRWHSDLLNDKEITLIIFFISTILLFFISLAKGDGLPTHGWTLFIFFAVVAAGLLNVINLFLTNYGFKRVEAVLASNLVALESVFGVIIGFLLYSEVLSFKEFLGGVLILLSVIGMNKLYKKKK